MIGVMLIIMQTFSKLCMCRYTLIVEHSIAKFYCICQNVYIVMMISFLMKCCNAKSNSLYQVRVQNKLIVQYFVITIYNYRSQDAEVTKETASTSILLAATWCWINRCSVHGMNVEHTTFLDLANNCTECSVIFIRYS